MQKKGDLEEATRFATSNLAAKSDLASLKAEIDKIDIDKLKTASAAALAKFSCLVDNDVAKKILYDKLVTKINFNKVASTSGFVSNTQ